MGKWGKQEMGNEEMGKWGNGDMGKLGKRRNKFKKTRAKKWQSKRQKRPQKGALKIEINLTLIIKLSLEEEMARCCKS